VFLNLGGEDFRDISVLTTADSDGDARSVFPADLDGDGRQDLVVRQVGGGPLLVFHNRFPVTNHWLVVSLRGTDSNSRGIGARLVAHVGEQAYIRDLFPANGPSGLGATQVHFGLGGADTVDELTIRWPSGQVQVLRDLAVDRHVVIEEGSDVVEVVTPP